MKHKILSSIDNSVLNRFKHDILLFYVESYFLETKNRTKFTCIRLGFDCGHHSWWGWAGWLRSIGRTLLWTCSGGGLREVILTLLFNFNRRGDCRGCGGGRILLVGMFMRGGANGLCYNVLLFTARINIFCYSVIFIRN